MNPSAEDHLRRAASYERLTEYEGASREQRIVFAKEANWLRLRARLAEEQAAALHDCRRLAIPQAMRPRQDRGRFRWNVSRYLAAVVHTFAERLRG